MEQLFDTVSPMTKLTKLSFVLLWPNLVYPQIKKVYIFRSNRPSSLLPSKPTVPIRPWVPRKTKHWDRRGSHNGNSHTRHDRVMVDGHRVGLPSPFSFSFTSCVEGKFLHWIFYVSNGETCRVPYLDTLNWCDSVYSPTLSIRNRLIVYRFFWVLLLILPMTPIWGLGILYRVGGGDGAYMRLKRFQN